jgi:hypothetical protein
MKATKKMTHLLAMRNFVITICVALIFGTNVSQNKYSYAQNTQPRAYLPMLMIPARPKDDVPIVFVQRQILDRGSIYYDPAKDMPGVGAHSRFRPAAPGKLIIRELDGSLRVLVDGSKPTSASLNLIDVNAPEVSWDGKKIVFAGLPNALYDSRPASFVNAWRIYSVNVDGTGLKQVTFSQQSLDLASLGIPNALDGHDDFDPVWLPDGRIVFSSTRYPSFAHYSGVRATNLYVVNPDGSGMRRITSERNGAERPMIEPSTGRIVFARWWRNHRFAYDDMTTVSDPQGGYRFKDGLSAIRNIQLGGGDEFSDMLWRNAWQISSINPDGTEVKMWSGQTRNEEQNHMYGGTFLANGDIVANYFPMFNMTEAGGFGGLRLFKPGAHIYTPLMGITTLTRDYVYCPNFSDCSYGIFKGEYISEPEAMPSGRLIVSIAKDIGQDYGLYAVDLNGSNRKLIYDNSGTSELQAKLIQPRPTPPIIADKITQTPSLLPPAANGPYDKDGTFVFDALNVYGNAPVDFEMVNAPPVGSAAKIRFFADFQRSSPGSFPNLDWPILLSEIAVNADGSVRNNTAPANISLFEQIRDANNKVPLTTDLGDNNGAAHVAGMNYGRPGEVGRCIGCHAGHSMIPLPSNLADAKFSNVAPGAAVSVSSSRDPRYNIGVNDRRVQRSEIWRYWTTPNGQQQNQWVKLTFPVPVTVRNVRLYNPRFGDEANSSLQVNSTRVTLYSDAAGTQQVGSQTTGGLSVDGTEVSFSDVKTRVVKVDITGMSGTFYGMSVASIAEIEVIARAEAP